MVAQLRLKRHLLGADAFAIASMYLATPQPTLVVANDAYSANRIINELMLFLPGCRIAIFPDNEILPYEKATPQKDITASRLKILWQIQQQLLDIVIVQLNTLQTRLCPTNYLSAKVLLLKIGDKLDSIKLRQNLINCNYTYTEQVYEPGEFAVRGSIIDIMPMGIRKLVRIDLYEDEIETLKILDPKTKQILEDINSYELIPAQEYPTDEQSIQQFIERFQNTFTDASQYVGLLKDIAHGIFPAGSNFYLPLFFTNLSSLFDYITNDWQIIYFSQALNHLNHNWQELTWHYELAQIEYPALPPVQLFIPSDNIFAALKQHKTIFFEESGELDNHIQLLPNLSINTKDAFPLEKLRNFKDTHTNIIMIIVLDSVGRLEILRQTLLEADFEPQIIKTITQIGSNSNGAREHNEKPKPLIYLLHGKLYNGFIYKNFAFISEEDLYSSTYQTGSVAKKRKTQKIYTPLHESESKINNDAIIRDLADVVVGDYVVHLNHGIGRYLGLSRQTIDEISYDMLEVEYQDEAKLFVPISQLHLISRYTAESGTVNINKLGSSSWNKIKTKTERQISDMAAELLELYAKRSALKRDQFVLPDEYHEFVANFPYEATSGQEECFAAVINDMTSSTPMDRLICGDVGFGKTEVAIRAAFIAAMNGKQVVLLAPTTLLSEQHQQSFVNRYAGWPIKVAEISRFKSAVEIKQTLELVKTGMIDILIGTHRIIQADVDFANLGLVIIDEEHRFGVKQKERLKHLRANVDFLTMAATPIPRTLSMAMDGIRDLSIIATPPKHRLAVNTIIIRHEDKQTIREAILREIRRGGQIFFLFNDVANIEKMYAMLSDMIPEVQIAIAHGQMSEHVLEQTIRDFIKQRFHILLCSVIIETGLDIANANTIIIYDAHKLGLAALYQLRGRVGRSHHQAYCYLVTPEQITPDAEKRLDAILATTELGSGFNLAMHDLEIRGAGEILGDNQSGNIKQVGLSLYTEMLEREVSLLKAQQDSSDTKSSLPYITEVNLHTTSIIPDDYCPDIHERLVYYKRLAKAYTSADVDQVYQDIIDNADNMPPEPLKCLIAANHLRVKAHSIGVTKFDVSATQISITFSEHPVIHPQSVVSCMQKLRSCHYKNSRLFWQINSATIKERIKHANTILDELIDFNCPQQ